jgi:hypothetical protein
MLARWWFHQIKLIKIKLFDNVPRNRGSYSNSAALKELIASRKITKNETLKFIYWLKNKKKDLMTGNNVSLDEHHKAN